MAIDKKLIHFKTYSTFISSSGVGSETNISTPTSGTEANNNAIYGQIKGTSIVFIKDTQQIWTHGKLYNCYDPDLSNYLTNEDLNEIQTSINNLNTNLTKNYVTNSALTTKLASKQNTISDLSTIRSGAALGATALQEEDLDDINNSISTINTTLGTKANSSDLDNYALKTSLSSYVPTSRTINSKKLTGNITLSAADVNAASTSDFEDLQESVNALTTTVGNKLDSSTASSTYATKTELTNGLSGKQATLVSGTNIKTIEGKSILGSGDIQITAANVGAYTTSEVDTKVTTLNNSINSVSTQATTNKNNIATLNAAVGTSGSVRTIAKSYADAAESNANDYTDEVKTALQTQITNNDADIATLTNKFSNYATTSNLTAVSNRVASIEGLIATDSDSVIDKWDEVVTFLDGIGADNDLEALLAAKANTTAVNSLQTQVNSLTTANVAESGNLYFTNARAQAAITGAASTVRTTDLTASRALVSNSTGKIAVSAVTSTELGYLDGVTSNIQTQLNDKASTDSLNITNTNVTNLTSRVSTVEGYFTSGKAKTASAADSATTATTATNLSAAPSLAKGTSDTSKITVTAGGKTSSEFTVPYATSAGSANTATSATTATTATKVGSSTVGGTTTPIYLNAGVPTKLSYTIAKSVPSNAVFTDTTYSAGTGLSLSGTTFSADGNAIINALSEGGSPAQRDDYIVAQYAGGGTTTTTYHRRKLSNIFAALNSSDITTALGYTPPTTNTTYSAGTGLSLSGTTFSTKYGTTAGTACQGNDSRLSNSRPASDVYAWAKASSKPSYKTSEVTEETNLYFTNTRAINACSGTYLPLSGGTINGNLTVNGYVAEGMNTATSVASIPITKGSCKCTISAAGSFSLASTPVAGRTIHVLIYNSSSSAKTVTLPNSGSYKSFSGTSLSVPAKGYAEVSVFSDGSTMFIRAGY